MTEKLKVVFPLWNFTKAGGGRVISKLGELFIEKGIETTFIVYYKSTKIYYPTKAALIFVDVFGNQRAPEIFDSTKLSTMHRVADIMCRFFALYNGLRKFSKKYNVAIATYNLTVFPVIFSKVKNRFYYIQAYEIMSDKKSFFSRVLRQCTRWSYQVKTIQIVNANLYKSYKEIHTNYMVPPGIDLSVYYPKQHEWNKISPITVGCIGRNEEWKGSQDVADAVEILLKKMYPVNFVVAFNPVKCSKYKLVKPDGDSNLADYYRNIDILIAPGTIQLGAIHYPVIEAMACGTTVITTGYYPANKLNSYLVPVSRPDVIADTIIYIAEHYNEALKKVKVGLQDIQQFDWDKVSSDFIKILKENTKVRR